MKWVATLVAISAIGLPFAAQATSGESDESAGPPEESLGRAWEEIEAAICVIPDRAKRERELKHTYQARRDAVHRHVVAEFGAEVADRGYISVQPCRRYESRKAFETGLALARKGFEMELVRWERHYNISPPKSH